MYNVLFMNISANLGKYLYIIEKLNDIVKIRFEES